ncbi:hypothetical protein SAMN05421857_0133 [Chryseobacterium formosense]|nr:hypothetical protein SAMN05421857_0133 [Chryseobacterium formosense]
MVQFWLKQECFEKYLKMKIIEKKVINESGAIEHLKIFYPSLQNEIVQLSAQNNFAGIIQTTVDHMKNLLKESKINIVNHNIKMMDWLYRNGTKTVKQMIENLFVRSFRSFKKQTDINQWNLLYQYMPLSFQRIYVKQTKMDEVLFKRH